MTFVVCCVLFHFASSGGSSSRKRLAGRPKKVWIDCVKRDLNTLGLKSKVEVVVVGKQICHVSFFKVVYDGLFHFVQTKIM